MVDCSRTEIYLSEKNRMTKGYETGVCHIRCQNCLLGRGNSGKDISCMELELKHPNLAVEIVQRWSDAHPKKTYLTQFMDNYPNAELGDDGTPKYICPYALGLNNIETCEPGEHHCVECWNQIID